MEDLRVSHERFQRRVLAVRLGAFGAKLLVDGIVVEREHGAYPVDDDDGNPTRIHLKAGVDPIPKVEINGEVVLLARPLAWYEYAWAAWPLGLVVVGGALGGLLGALAATMNVRVLRSQLPLVVRYALSAFLGVLAVVLWAGIGGLLFTATSSAR